MIQISHRTHNNHWNLLQLFVFLQNPFQLINPHLWHHDICENQIDILPESRSKNSNAFFPSAPCAPTGRAGSQKLWIVLPTTSARRPRLTSPITFPSFSWSSWYCEYLYWCAYCACVVLLSPSEELFLLFSFEPEFDFCWSCPCKISAAGGLSPFTRKNSTTIAATVSFVCSRRRRRSRRALLEFDRCDCAPSGSRGRHLLEFSRVRRPYSASFESRREFRVLNLKRALFSFFYRYTKADDFAREFKRPKSDSVRSFTNANSACLPFFCQRARRVHFSSFRPFCEREKRPPLSASIDREGV